MTPLPFDCCRCRPQEPDHNCRNCKRWADHPEQTWGPRTASVATTGSRDEACMYVPISLLEKTK